MNLQLEAIFENGVLRPLQPIPLADHQRVTVSIDSCDVSIAADASHFVLSSEKWEQFCAALDAPPRDIPALRKLLAEKGIFDEPGIAAE